MGSSPSAPARPTSPPLSAASSANYDGQSPVSQQHAKRPHRQQQQPPQTNNEETPKVILKLCELWTRTPSPVISDLSRLSRRITIVSNGMVLVGPRQTHQTDSEVLMEVFLALFEAFRPGKKAEHDIVMKKLQDVLSEFPSDQANKEMLKIIEAASPPAFAALRFVNQSTVGICVIALRKTVMKRVMVTDLAKPEGWQIIIDVVDASQNMVRVTHVRKEKNADPDSKRFFVNWRIDIEQDSHGVRKTSLSITSVQSDYKRLTARLADEIGVVKKIFEEKM